MRQIVLDTETTGLEHTEGHRIIEIGCIEMVDRKQTGTRFHVYLNPDREVDEGAVEVHGLSNEFLSDKPRFEDIAEDFISFIKGTEVIIHNAAFDVGFINHELKLWRDDAPQMGDLCRVLDTLIFARKRHPGQRNSLDALCKRYEIDNAHRTLHGALLDAEILTDVYLSMTGGQTVLNLDPDAEDEFTDDALQRFINTLKPPEGRPRLKVLKPTAAEEAAHRAKLEEIEKAYQLVTIFNQMDATQEGDPAG